MTEQDFLSLLADRLIGLAQAYGYVVIIELKPKEPLAMGNYEMVADVRPAREAA